MAGLHRPEDFGPLAAAAVVESDRLRKGIRCGNDVIEMEGETKRQTRDREREGDGDRDEERQRNREERMNWE